MYVNICLFFTIRTSLMYAFCAWKDSQEEQIWKSTPISTLVWSHSSVRFVRRHSLGTQILLSTLKLILIQVRLNHTLATNAPRASLLILNFFGIRNRTRKQTKGPLILQHLTRVHKSSKRFIELITTAIYSNNPYQSKCRHHHSTRIFVWNAI